MYRSFTLLVSLMLLGGFAFSVDIAEVRKLYKEAPDNEEKAEKLYNMLSGESKLTPLLLAYKGATKAILAKHVFMVNKKYSYAKDGIQTLHRAVELEGSNIEIRYLRFTIEYHLPSFLGLSKDLDEDKNAFVKHMGKRTEHLISSELFKEMARFMIDSGKCTEEEKRKIREEANIK